MSEPTLNPTAPQSSDTNMQEMRKGVAGKAGTPQVFTIGDHESGDDQDPFYQWPSLPAHPAKLPPDFLATIEKHRGQIAEVPGIGAYQSGFSYKGEEQGVAPVPLLEDSDKRQYANPIAQERLIPILEHLPKEITGEGGASAAMTGDSAKFTWGHGLTGLWAIKAFTRFVSTSWPIKKAFLNHGIAVDAGKWKVVDLATGTYKEGDAALSLLDGKTPAEVKKNFISTFATLTQDHLQEAENAQWKTWKEFFFQRVVKPPESVIISEAWKPEAVCYVVHCAGWGRFPGWDKFLATGGDPRKILRVEADCTFHYDDPGNMFVMQDYQQDNGKMVHPSTTMVFNMGHGLMYKNGFLTPCQNPKTIANGDAVFEIHPAWRKHVGGAPFGVLANVPRQVAGTAACKRPPSAEQEYAEWVAKNQGLSMQDLLKVCEARGYKKLKDTRDWYGLLIQDPAFPDDPSRKIAPNQTWGFRPRVAMDAVLHKGEGNASGWILSDAARAEITPDNCSDQYALLKAKIGIA